MIKTIISSLVNNFNKKTNRILLFLFGIFMPFIFVNAACVGVICNPISQDSIEGLLKTILEGVIKIGIPVVALALVYCGFLFVQARGNPKEIEKARNSFIYTLIGTAILLGSWAIAQLISETVLSL
jgi:Na+-translocating ferredoxin:NAD+ oxidoreductase RnfA subunit